MTWKTIPRLAAGAVALVLLSGTCVAASAAHAAIYIDGTITAIPINTEGTLELGNSGNLEFRYGETSYAIPSASISAIRVGKPRNGLASHVAGGASRLGRTVLPIFFSKDKYLTVDYGAGEAAGTQRAVFRVPAELAAGLVPVLREKVAQNRAAAAKVAEDPDNWWGNRYWKTNRNRHLWKARNKQQAKADEAVAVVAKK